MFKLRNWGLTGLIFVIFVLFNCGEGGEENLDKVRIIINTWPGLGPYYVAEEMGFDKEMGINLEVIMSEDTEARRSSLMAGEVDLVGITMDAVILSNSKGFPMTVVGLSDMSYGGDGIIARTEIKEIQDLKNKKIACAEGMPSHFFLMHLLNKYDMKPDDIELIPVKDGGKAAFLFTSDRVDAAVTWDPWITKAEELTDGHVLITTRDEPGLILGIVAANRNLLPEKKNRIYKVLKAWDKAVEYTRENPDKAAAIMAEKYNVPIDDFKLMASGAKLFNIEEALQFFGTKENPGEIYELVKTGNQIWLNSGIIKESVKTEKVIDYTIMNMF